MSCHHIRRRLSAYCDDELHPAAKRKILRHLASCAQCREEVAAILALDVEFRRESAPEPSPGFSGNVMQRIYRIEKKGKRRAPRWVPAMMYSLIFASVFSAVLLWKIPPHGVINGNSTLPAWIEVLEEGNTMSLSQLQDHYLGILWSEANESP